MRKLVILERHGERSDEAPLHRQIDHEFKSDPPLTELGHEMSEYAAKAILELVPPESSIHLVSSPLIRCIQTCSKFAKLANVPIHLEEGFGEMFTMNDFPYNPYEHLHIRVQPERFTGTLGGVQLIENQHMCRPNYPESPEQLRDRISRVLVPYIEQVKEPVVVICSHQLPLEEMLRQMGADTQNLTTNYTLVSAAYYDGNWQLVKIGDYSHLPPNMVKPVKF